MLINTVKTIVNNIIEITEYCLYGLFRVLIAPFRVVSIYKDYVAMKQYHESLGYVEVNDSTHKHDNYQSQIDGNKVLIDRNYERVRALINRENACRKRDIELLEKKVGNPMTLNPDTVTKRLDDLEKKLDKELIFINFVKQELINKETTVSSLFKKREKDYREVKDSMQKRLDNLEKHINEGILKEIRDLGHIEADRLGIEVAVEEKESIRDEKYQWKREQELIDMKIEEVAKEDE